MAPFLETLALVRCSGRRRVGIFVSHKFRQSGWRSVAPACLSSPTLRQFESIVAEPTAICFCDQRSSKGEVSRRRSRWNRFRGRWTPGEYLQRTLGRQNQPRHPCQLNKKYEPPHEGEPLTLEGQEEILDLLCEEYDYRGVSYEVVMDSRLSVQMGLSALPKRKLKSRSHSVVLPSDTTESVMVFVPYLPPRFLADRVR